MTGYRERRLIGATATTTLLVVRFKHFGLVFAMLKNFFDIDGRQQYDLIIGLLQRFADSDAPTLEDLSEKEGSTPDAIWSDMCRAQDVEPCGVPSS